jgi:hypothetical protein
MEVTTAALASGLGEQKNGAKSSAKKRIFM